ncbi:hypothetical protein [Reichenbachiella ulvae]|uniref:DUF1524 domain-containing protein n=1 Tax=Reichenbachiella ulvae TaxID=2980104 RepID=A0ABT3CW84_9BACT|nr:hypothetical protein [Reichenbachiella ulvae]MCV9387972.1 hypothetical protein [Reichenbachiella ulvae]
MFDKLLEEYADFDKEHLNPRHAMNCATTSWHLTDWTYQEFFTTDKRFQDREKYTSKGNLIFISALQLYQQYLIKSCPELEYMRLITNGIKHCIPRDLNSKKETRIGEGHYSPYDYSRHDYNVPRFEIIISNSKSIDFESAVLKTLEFWKKFIEENKT